MVEAKGFQRPIDLDDMNFTGGVNDLEMMKECEIFIDGKERRKR